MDDKRIKRAFRRYFEEDPAKYGKILSVFHKHKNWISAQGTPEIKFYPFVCQLWEGRDEGCIEYDLMCAVAWQYIANNRLKYSLQETPRCHKDSAIDKNKNLVESYVTNIAGGKITDADFWGGTQGEDGFIEFSESPIHEGCQTRFPLEIGYITPTQFFYHIEHSRCIARLPYESDYIVYFELTG